MSLAAFRTEFAHLEQKRVERFVGWMVISPQTAQTWLDRYNKRNRGIRKTRVTQYTADIREGRWVENGETLIITEDGILASGQHTLLAVIEAGVSVVRLVVVGVPREAIFCVDLVSAKQLRDFFRIDGIHDPSALQGAVAYKSAYDDKCMLEPARKAALTIPFKREVVFPAHPGLAKCLAEIPNPLPGFGGRALWAWLFYEFQERDVGAARDFVWQALEGTNISKTSPVYGLRRNLERKGTGKRASKINSTYVAALAIKTWNATRNGERGKVAVWKTGEPFPEIK